MKNNTKLYDVNNLYLLTTHRKVRVYDDTTRYIIECFIGKKCNKKYIEFFSLADLEISEKFDALEFDKIYVVSSEKLSKYIDKTYLTKKEIFEFLTKTNSFERSALDIVD